MNASINASTTALHPVAQPIANVSSYQNNLQAFKNLLDKYTIADIHSMIYDIPIKDSGSCCYPALQTLIALMELLGHLISNLSDGEAFTYVLSQLGVQYESGDLARNLYERFRNGIAHLSLAKSGVQLIKNGDRTFHLSENGSNIDVRLLFEDFLQFYNELFSTRLLKLSEQPYYEKNLKKIFKNLNCPWIRDTFELTVPNSTPTFVTPSGIYSGGPSGVRGPINFQ